MYHVPGTCYFLDSVEYFFFVSYLQYSLAFFLHSGTNELLLAKREAIYFHMTHGWFNGYSENDLYQSIFCC